MTVRRLQLLKTCDTVTTVDRHTKPKGGALSPTLLTVREAAVALRVSRPTVYRWIKKGRLQAYRYGQPHHPSQKVDFGGALRVSIPDVEREIAA